ncbi:MAG TPA: Gfo/Idh/MocA family oxidoreductase [Planctomycetota bacterium]|nr:Gfo/Idh/MocA family oxidoreductase [Planctomycetota bacterium]
MLKIGVIGHGRRIGHMMKDIARFSEGAKITAIADIRNEEIKKILGDRAAGVEFFDTPEAMLDTADLDGVAIGTRCSLHAKMAIKVAKSGLPLFLEKPVATTMADLRALKNAFAKSKCQVVVSFPLRLSPLVKLAKELIAAGEIGPLSHVEAWNHPGYGTDAYYMNWYRDENETGGLWLQKATHDFDYLNHVIEAPPLTISAMDSKQVYKGTMPAGLKCVDCKLQKECIESPYNRFYKQHLTPEVQPNEFKCAFAVDTGNHDSATALIRYEGGLHAVYTQCFYARRSAAGRGARLIGQMGTIHFDWHIGELILHKHHTARVVTHKFTSTDGHGGGDDELLHDFIDCMKGKKNASRSPLSAGLLSGLMCMKAKESCATEKFLPIRW